MILKNAVRCAAYYLCIVKVLLVVVLISNKLVKVFAANFLNLIEL